MELTFDKSQFLKVVSESESVSDVCRFSNKPKNGYYNKLFKKWIQKFECDVSHFDKKVESLCVECGKIFRVIKSKKDKRKFCSLLCANQKVRGKALSRPDEDLICQNKHKVICFRYHKKECCVCGITNPVAVHHYNENHSDDRPENLVPICPNHHILLHTNEFNIEIQPKVDEYVKRFTNGGMV